MDGVKEKANNGFRDEHVAANGTTPVAENSKDQLAQAHANGVMKQASLDSVVSTGTKSTTTAANNNRLEERRKSITSTTEQMKAQKVLVCIMCSTGCAPGI